MSRVVLRTLIGCVPTNIIPTKISLTYPFRQARQAVEFLFFFALVVCAQRMLSQAVGKSRSLQPRVS